MGEPPEAGFPPDSLLNRGLIFGYATIATRMTLMNTVKPILNLLFIEIVVEY
jgi:hypothetical protein